MELSYLLLGSNTGDRLHCLRSAIEHLGRDAGKIVAVSAVHETEPWGFNASQMFLNQAVAIETQLDCFALLERSQRIEKLLGRERSIGNGYQSRTIDIDILFYGVHIINTTTLVVPHPLIEERLFALAPMIEIAPDFEHPVLNKTMAYLHEQLSF